jgi:hypothetical protein
MPLLPKGMIFIDNKLSSSNIATYLNNRFPEELRITKPFRHFHSDMSQQYLEEIFEDLTVTKSIQYDLYTLLTSE